MYSVFPESKSSIICFISGSPSRISFPIRLLELFHLDEPEDGEEEPGMSVDELEEVLSAMMDYAYEQGIMTENSIVYRDLFDTKIMSMLVPRPSEVIAEFEARYGKSPEEATEYFYKLSQDTDYIRRYRIRKDQKWIAPTKYGRSGYYH